MNKQPEITENTRKTLMKSFCRLYSQKPIHKITIKEITDVAGYHRSTFYEYFQDIYDLLEAIENDLLNTIKTPLQDIGTMQRQSADMEHLIFLFSQNEDYLSALLGTYGSFHFLGRLKRELCEDVQLSNMQPDTNTTPYLLEFHMSTSISLFQLWLKRKKDLSSHELSELIHKLYTSGISSFLL